MSGEGVCAVVQVLWESMQFKQCSMPWEERLYGYNIWLSGGFEVATEDI